MRKPNHSLSLGGFSAIELLAVLGLMGVLLVIAASNLKELDSPLNNGAAQMTAFFKQARAEAISSTMAYIIQPESTTRIITKRGTTCSDANPVNDPRVALTLPNGATLTSTAWSFCFSSRGLPDANIEINLQDIGGAGKTVEVMLGGAVRIL